MELLNSILYDTVYHSGAYYSLRDRRNFRI